MKAEITQKLYNKVCAEHNEAGMAMGGLQGREFGLSTWITWDFFNEGGFLFAMFYFLISKVYLSSQLKVSELKGRRV